MAQQPTESAKAPSAIPDWGADAPGSAPSPWLLPALAIVIISALLGGAVAALGGAVAGATVAMLSFLAALAWLWVQPRWVLSRAAARPLAEGEHPRLANLAVGLARDMHMPAPSIRLIDDGPPNALATYVGNPVIVVSTSFLESLTRTELEAVVAHTLLRTDPGAVRVRGLRGAVGPLAGTRDPTLSDDLRTCAVTRYPPALAAAIGKAVPAGGRWSAFWFVGSGGSVATQEERIRALEDL
jgi:hypothetical protein